MLIKKTHLSKRAIHADINNSASRRGIRIAVSLPLITPFPASLTRYFSVKCEFQQGILIIEDATAGKAISPSGARSPPIVPETRVRIGRGLYWPHVEYPISSNIS